MITHRDLGWDCAGSLSLIGDIYIDGQDWNVYECQSCKKVLWKVKGMDAAMEGDLNKADTIKTYFSKKPGFLNKIG
jgi:hypothetical protein